MAAPPSRLLGLARAQLRAHPRRAALLGALLLACAARALLPGAVRLALEWQGTKQLGRVVQVGDVGLSLVRGGFELDGVAVGPPFEGDVAPPLDPADAQFRAARIAASWSWLDLLRREVHLDRVELASPEIVLVRGPDGRLVPVLRPRPKAAPKPAETGEEGSGWPVQLDALRIHDLEALFIDTAHPERNPLDLNLAELSLDALHVEGRNITLGGLGLRAPRLRVRRDIDLTPFLAAPAGQASAAAKPAAPAPPLGYQLARIDLEGATFTLVTDQGEIETRLAVHARGVTGAQGVAFPLDVRIEVGGGWLEVKGQTVVYPPAFDGQIQWSALPLRSFALAAGAALPWKVAAGATSGQLAVEAGSSSASGRFSPRVDVSGQLSVDGLDAAAEQPQLAVRFAGLDVTLESLALRPAGEAGHPVPPEIHLASLVLRDPDVHVERRAPAAEASAPAAEPQAAAPEPKAPAAADAGAAPHIALDELDLTGGRVEFVDTRVEPAHHSNLSDLAVRGRGLRWPQRDAESLAVSFHGPGEARFDAKGALRDGRGKVTFALADLGLADFSPYSADAGYWIGGGRGSLRGSVVLGPRRTNVDTDVSLRRLDVSEVSASSFEKQFGVPLDLALALLRDPSGDIDLPLDVSIDERKSGVALRPLIVSALRQALVGVLSSPLKGLGLVLGQGGGEGEGLHLAPLDLAPGAAALGPRQSKALAEVAKLLANRPGLGIELRGQVGPEDERPLAQRILTREIVADAELPPVDAGFLQKRRLRSALTEHGPDARAALDAADAQALERWIAAVPVGKAERRELAGERAAAVRDALVTQYRVDPARVEIGKPATGPPGVTIALRPLGS